MSIKELQKAVQCLQKIAKQVDKDVVITSDNVFFVKKNTHEKAQNEKSS